MMIMKWDQTHNRHIWKMRGVVFTHKLNYKEELAITIQSISRMMFSILGKHLLRIIIQEMIQVWDWADKSHRWSVEVNTRYHMELKTNQFNKITAKDKKLMECSLKTTNQKTSDPNHMTELLAKVKEEEAVAIWKTKEVVEERWAMKTADTTVGTEAMIHSILVELRNCFLELKAHLTASNVNLLIKTDSLNQKIEKLSN